MTANSLASIVTPAYNAARFIADTIRSVQAQTHRNWEMIVVDDCSNDATREIVQEFARSDSRIRLIQQPRNGGPSAARETAVRAADGRYVAFLDSDDLWLSSKLERQLRFMGDIGGAISFTQFRRISEGGAECGRLIRIPDRLTYRQLLRNTAMATSTVVIDRLTTGPFQMRSIACDDYALWLDITKRGFAAYGLQEDLMRYRVVSQSFSRNKAKYALKIWHTYRDLGLSAPYAGWCFTNYAVRAWLKYRRF